MSSSMIFTALLYWAVIAAVISAIAFFVIRGAVLAALRKHAAEQRAQGQQPPVGL